MPNEALQLESASPAIIKYIKELETRIKEIQNNYETNIKELENKCEKLKLENALLLHSRFGRSAEQLRVDSKQPQLFDNEEIKGAKGKQEEYEEVRSHKRRKCGRKTIDSSIPRVERIIDIPEEEKTCACGARLTRIGEETSEKLQIIAPRIYVEKTIRPKYACRHCEGTEDEGKKTVRMAAVEPAIIPKSIVSPSLLSCIIIQKYADHLPYFRQEKQFERIKVSISRQDMSNWQQQAYKRLRPLFDIMKETLRSGPVMQMDETETQVMGEMTGKEKREDTLKSRMWLARGGPPGKPVVMYEYRQTRAAKNAKEIFGSFSGYLQTDGYPGYDTAVEGNTGIKLVGCFAHARRKFFEAAKVSPNSGMAEEGMNHIKKLYVIEGKLRKRYEGKEGDTEEQKNEKIKMFTRVRQLCAWRILKEFKEWLIKQKEVYLPSSAIGKAISYSLGQWDKLVRYLESPYLTPDNNACENAIRPFVIGRNSWMFNKSPEGAESSCGMYSLIQTAKANGIEPSRYLTALFEKAPVVSSRTDWEKLLPWNIFKQ